MQIFPLKPLPLIRLCCRFYCDYKYIFYAMPQFSPILSYYICHLENKVKNKFKTRECDYSKIMAIALPQYFDPMVYSTVPEFVLNGNYKPDYLVSIISTDGNDLGKSFNLVNVEAKDAETKQSWEFIIKEQLWDQCDNSKQEDSGRIWAILIRGFEVCFFHFDIEKYDDSVTYRNFSALNLRKLNGQQLTSLGVGYITELDTNGVSVIRVIKWEFNKLEHRIHINEMFNHIVTNNP